MKSSNHHYNKRLKAFAREHRNNSTKAEIKLWVELLSKRQMLGFQFLRQRPISNYIADFFCKELKLIIEADGFSHTWEITVEKDRKKTEELEAIGYRILRFEDSEILEDIDRVGETIEKWIQENR